MVAGVRGAIRESGATTEESVRVLRQDLLNIPHHVLGRHDQCRSSYCSRKKEDDLVHVVEKGGLLTQIMKYIDSVVRKADRLTSNVTINQAER